MPNASDAFSLDDASIAARFHQGTQLAAQKNFRAAQQCFTEILEHMPRHVGAIDGMVRVALSLCDWDLLERWSPPLMAIANAGTSEAVGISPYSSLLLGLSAEQQWRVAKAHARSVTAVPLPSPPVVVEGPTGERLRVGYLSADFRQHILGDMIWDIFAWHDRQRFEMFAYATQGDDGSVYYQKFCREAEHFVDLEGFSSQAAAQRIAQDQLDLLIFLGGYTAHDHPEVLAYRPAPLQATWLDYPATLGADWVDYILVDQHIVPPEMACWFSEKLVYLPLTYQMNHYVNPLPPTPSREALGLPDGFVFCCLNKSNRIHPERFSCWMRILKQVSNSVLWLLQPESASPSPAEERLRTVAVQAGVSPDRLYFAPGLPKDRHIARQAQADLFLDTGPSNGHTTVSDALWAGVPVLTLPGDAMTGRVATGLLHAVGLPQLVAKDIGDYETLAVRLATVPGDLQRYREQLAQARATGSQGTAANLFNTRALLRSVEAAYVLMHNHRRAGVLPAVITVPPEVTAVYLPVSGAQRALLAQADTLGQSGDFIAARARCEQVLAESPQQPRALHLLGLSFLMTGQPQQALMPLQAAHEHCPQQVDVLKHLGTAQCQLQHFQAGVTTLQKALALQPNAPDILYPLALAYQRCQQPDAARVTFQILLRLVPHHPAARKALHLLN
jgi:protein O-GlcNAc transferase